VRDELVEITRRYRIHVSVLAALTTWGAAGPSVAQGDDGQLALGAGEREQLEPGRTTLSNPAIRYSVPEKPYVVLRRGDVEAVVVDNRAVDDEVVRGHHAGYSGLAVLRHTRRQDSLFVPAYGGLNFEHIHDGTTQPRAVLFEPRNAPVEMRRIDELTVELYQRPTPHWGLESCLRYAMLPDGPWSRTPRGRLEDELPRPRPSNS
jgi:hypothetical protein